MRHNGGFTKQADMVIDMGVDYALRKGAKTFTVAHLFMGFLKAQFEPIKSIMKTTGISCSQYNREMDKCFPPCELNRNNEISVSQSLNRVIAHAKAFAKVNCDVDEVILLRALIKNTCLLKNELSEVFINMGYNCWESYDAIDNAILKGLKKSDYSATDAHQSLSNTQTKTSSQKSQPFLTKYGKDLTTLAEDGQLDPVACRDDEIQRAIRTLMRRRKCNPCLIGKAGVGKSAIVEGMAQYIADMRAPNTNTI